MSEIPWFTKDVAPSVGSYVEIEYESGPDTQDTLTGSVTTWRCVLTVKGETPRTIVIVPFEYVVRWRYSNSRGSDYGKRR